MDMEPDPKPFTTVQQGRPVYGMPDPPRPRRSRLLLVGVPVLAVFTGFAAIVWMAYEGGAGSPAGEPPLIRAATSPIKLSPDQARGSDVAEEEGDVRELLSDIPFDQQLERLLPDLEEPLTPPAPVERAEPSPQPAPAPGQMAAVDLPSPEQADRPAEPPSAEVAPTPPQQPTQSPEPAPTATEPSEPAPATTESSEPAPPPAAQAPRPAPSRPAPTPASPESEPTAQAALDALIAEVTQTPAPQPDRRTETTETEDETEPPAVRPEPSTSSNARPPEQQMAATTPSGPPDPSSTGREDREPLITTAPGESQSASASGYRVQLAAVREQADARRAWDLFMLDLGPILSRYQPYFERANTANGIFYRVQVGPFASAGDAETVCDELKQRNASCFVVRR